MGAAAVLGEIMAVARPEASLSRAEVLTRYRPLREISKRHHSTALDFLAKDAIVSHARRIGLAQGKTLVLDSIDDLNLAFDLAIHTAPKKRGSFEPEKFQDEYEDALKELLRKKQMGEKIERAKEPSRATVVNLMDALRQSVQQEKKAPARAKKGRKRVEGQTEMLLPIAGKKGKEVAKPIARSSARQKRAG